MTANVDRLNPTVEVRGQHIGLKPDDVTNHSFKRGPWIEGNQNGLPTSM